MRKASLGAGVPCVALALTSWATRASGAGFDTPILYTARHQAMGGTAIGYVDDASAGFHNPAGLSAIRRGNVLADFSLLIGKVQSSPDPKVLSHESETTLAPFFLLAGGARVSEWLTLGLGLFPVASGGAEYEYPINGKPGVDSTTIVFAELTPFASIQLPRLRDLPGRLSIGVGYRMSALFFSRERGYQGDPQLLNLHMTGTNFSGVRLGLQYRPSSMFGVGFVFRNKIRVVTRADEVTVYTRKAQDAELDFVLPAKLGAGMAFDLAELRLATDVEYAFQDQNKTSALSGQVGGTYASVPNVFAWQNGMTLRFGAEYRLGQGALRYPVRVGYAFDSTVTNPQYPSAFGTPPAPTHTLSAGGGVRSGAWQVNLAITRRFGSTTVAKGTLGEGCSFCSYAGDYSIGMTGLYVDSSLDF